MSSAADAAPAPPRRRLSRDDRHQQLLDAAWRIVREEGTEALALGLLAQRAGVTKPVVYDHFGDRTGLLAALYQDFDGRQTVLMDAALAVAVPALSARVQVIADAYVDCVLTQGREIPGVIAALAGSPRLETVKRDYEAVFLAKCRAALAPFAPSGDVTPAGLRLLLGAAEALSGAAASGEITAAEAKAELAAAMEAMVRRG